MTEIESKIFLDLARIWNLGPGEVETIVRDYIGAVTCDFKQLQPYPKPRICIRPIKIKTLKERLEDNEMKATSVQVINAIKEMNVTFEKSPLEETRIIINVSTDDDTYEFNCSGPGCEKFLRKMNFVPTKEYEYVYNQLMEREKEINDLKKKHEKKIKQIEKELDLEKAANEAQRKFIKEYTGKDTEVTFNYAIGSGPITYGLYDKDYVDELRKKNNNLIAENVELKAKLCYKAKSADDIKKLKEQIKKFEKSSTDNVNHPSHYTGKYECIDVIQDVFGNEATNDFCLCNAFKYIWRARKKNGLEDVKKAVWYLNKYIEEAEKDGQANNITGT